MWHFFQKNKKNDTLHIQLKMLENEIKRLQSLEKKQEIHYHFQIEKIQVDTVNLEQLLFQLDKIHTEYLNGTLSIGNNFGLSNVEKAKRENEIQPQKKQSHLKSTKKGFSFTYKEGSNNDEPT